MAVFSFFLSLTQRTAKFSGYLYGGRPLGLSYVRYTNYGADTMEGQEATAPEHQLA
jgi:hypothetical protein